MADADADPPDARSQLARLGAGDGPAAFLGLRAGDPGARPAAVLILFSELPGSRDARGSGLTDLHVLLQTRAPTLRQHAGQVSFPGGRTEPSDTDAVQTALREAAEETGLDPSGVDVLAALPGIPLAVSNHRVTPVLAWWANPAPLSAIDPAETTRVWQASVPQLLDPSARFTSVLERRGTRFRGPAFDVDGAIVWGFTAMILDRIFDAVGWTVPWDASRERTIDA